MKSHIKHNGALTLCVPEPPVVEKRTPSKKEEVGTTELDFQAACRLQVTMLWGDDYEVLHPVPNL